MEIPYRAIKTSVLMEAGIQLYPLDWGLRLALSNGPNLLGFIPSSDDESRARLRNIVSLTHTQKKILKMCINLVYFLIKRAAKYDLAFSFSASYTQQCLYSLYCH